MESSIRPPSEGDNGAKPLHVVVIVMGDVGRSPRMQYHAQSLLEQGYTVSLVGYAGEKLVPGLEEGASNLNVIRFTTFSPNILRKFLPLHFAWRLLSLMGGLMWALWVAVPSDPPVDVLLVQNPPAIPLLAVTLLYSRAQGMWKRRKRPAIVIDWHNLGYSMLRNGSVVQKLARWYEQTLSPFADGHLCVTTAMKDYLCRDMQISRNISVLYDCPPEMFHPLTLGEQNEFLLRINSNLCEGCPRGWFDGLDPKRQSLLTEQVSGGAVRKRKGRPALVTSSTSWTEDEDFGILLDALSQLDSNLSKENLDRNILVVVTGKGPMKQMYVEKISKLTLSRVAIQTMWLEPEDYPRLLACADVGVSLHTSTSGLDLPMKVLDLFGCQVPVLALNFACLPELVHDGVNGRVFESSTQLADQLWSVLVPSLDGNDNALLDEYSERLQGITRWSENWKRHALPVILEASAPS